MSNDQYKNLKKQRQGYARILRAALNQVEGGFTVGNYDQVRHGLATMQAAAKKIELSSRLYMGDELDA